MRDEERAVLERLVQSHELLRPGDIVEPEADPPDAIVVLNDIRFGFELTDIFSVGGSNAAGSEYLQFDRHWHELRDQIVSVLQHQHANLDQCDIYLRLDRQSRNSFDLANLPRKFEYGDFAAQLLHAIFRHRPAFNAHSDEEVEVEIPSTSDFAALRRYASRIEIMWRPDSFGEVNVAARIHLPLVEGGYLYTGTQKLEAAILRKGNPSREQRKRIEAASVREVYLVLGGQRTGLLPHLQGQTRGGLERDLAFVRYPFEQSVFDGLILFDDLNDRIEVFCTRCLSSVQKARRVGVGPLDFYSPGMFDVPHACARLANGPATVPRV